MRQIKTIVTILALIALFACIKTFIPVIESDAENKYVVSGKITDEPGWQEVTVSLSSPIDVPQFIPVKGCQIVIKDNTGNDFQLEEYETGNYRIWLDEEYLIPGNAYMVSIHTPSGEIIESAYDTMPLGPHLDSVYYVLENVPTNDPEEFINGIQIYVDLHAEEVECRNYKWEIEQMFEYHANNAKEYYYDGAFHQIDPPDSSQLVCWSGGLVKNVYTLSTKNLSQNTFIKFPLHFISGSTPHLYILYSMLVRQLAISQGAFDYWEQVRVNSHELGGLYEKQPYAITGNLVNISNPKKDVLGYFFAAGQSSRRYFYKDIEGLVIDFPDYCNELPLGRMGWREYTWRDYPVYYYYPFQRLRILNNECVDCRLRGGTTTKPDFWP